MNPEFINKEWLRYRASDVPEDAEASQLVETKKAFFAGAIAMLRTIQDHGVCNISCLRAELAEFDRKMQDGEELLP